MRGRGSPQPSAFIPVRGGRGPQAAKPAGVTWPAALLEYGIKKTRANQLIAIADGRTTISTENEQANERKALHRASDRSGTATLSQKENGPDEQWEGRDAEAAEFVNKAVRRVRQFVWEA
jgi:hypothetical protein